MPRPTTSRSAPTAATGATADTGGVAALDRAFAILAAFGATDRGLTLAELANRTGLYKSTILRLAQSLIHHRFLARMEDGRFQIGPAPLALGAIYQRSVRLADVMLPAMRDLAAIADDGVSFYIRQGNQRMCLHRVDSRHAIKDHVREGDMLPLERGSGGRVLNAFSGAQGAIHERIRRDGYFISTGERDAETFGISAPVFGPGQALVGALTSAGPGFRMTEARLMKLRVPLLEAAAGATLALGGDAGFLLAAARMARSPGKTTSANRAKKVRS
ncbi:MAG: IclR family transcriptional regulator [Betaproteobacteria bacterium]|nr:IclR family transcriptional regulator [Betaproteobacteria bacterium]